MGFLTAVRPPIENCGRKSSLDEIALRQVLCRLRCVTKPSGRVVSCGHQWGQRSSGRSRLGNAYFGIITTAGGFDSLTVECKRMCKCWMVSCLVGNYFRSIRFQRRSTNSMVGIPLMVSNLAERCQKLSKTTKTMRIISYEKNVEKAYT